MKGASEGYTARGLNVSYAGEIPLSFNAPGRPKRNVSGGLNNYVNDFEYLLLVSLLVRLVSCFPSWRVRNQVR